MANDANNIELTLRREIAGEVEVVATGADRFGIITPMAFDDGDALPLVLRKDQNGWYLTDEGHTLLQLTYELEETDFRQTTRREIINKNLSMFGLKNRRGELVLPIEDNKFGDALYTFAQALVKIDDIRYLSRERVRSTFIADVHSMVRRIASPKREVVENWHDPVKDPSGIYSVDCKVNGTGKPLFVFALPNDERVARAVAALYKFEKWESRYDSIGIFEDQSKIDPKWVARFTDVCNKPFSTLAEAEDRIGRFYPDYFVSEPGA